MYNVFVKFHILQGENFLKICHQITKLPSAMQCLTFLDHPIYAFIKIKLALCHLLLYAVYIYQKLLIFIDAFNCYKEKRGKLAPVNLAHPVAPGLAAAGAASATTAAPHYHSALHVISTAYQSGIRTLNQLFFSYPNRATDPKRILMLAKSPESAHKQIRADRLSIFRVIAYRPTVKFDPNDPWPN